MSDPSGRFLVAPGPRRRALAVGLAAAGAALVRRASGALADSDGASVAGASTMPATAILAADLATERYVQKYALSCEYAATHIALRLLGFDVSEDTMRTLMGSGEDPDETFRGEIQANQNLTDYGIHARGVAQLMERLRSGHHVPAAVEAHLLYDLDSIRRALSQGHPVVTWIPLDLRASSRVAVQLSTGKVVHLVYAEHAITVRGYDEGRVMALDPHAGSPVTYDAERFAQAMAMFDDPALAISLRPEAPAAPAAPAVPTSEHFAETNVTLDGGFYRTFRELGGRDALGLPLTGELYEPDVRSGANKMVVYTEAARLEWYPERSAFGTGFVGEELLGEGAAADPDMPVVGAIGRYVAAAGGLERFGFALRPEEGLSPDDPVLPDTLRGRGGVVGQWFQAGLVLWAPDTGAMLGRAGLALARQRGLA